MLDGWHEFYGLLGTAAAALVALLFVAASIGAGYSRAERRSATRTFTSPIVFHYTYVLFLSLAALVPDQHRSRRSRRFIGVSAAIALGLFVFHTAPACCAVPPAISTTVSPMAQRRARAYLAALAASVFIFERSEVGPPLLAGALVLLLLVNIRNAWDLTVFFAQRRTDNPLPPPAAPAAPNATAPNQPPLTLIFAPAFTFASVFTSPIAFAQILQGLASRVSSPLRDRRAAKADGDGVAVGPVGDLAGRDDRPGVRLACDLHRDFEINLLPPGQRRARDRQRRRNRLRRRRIKQFGIERDGAEIKSDAHGVLFYPAPRSGEGGRAAQRAVEGASATSLAQAPHAPSTAQTRGPPPPLRFTTRGRISECVPATRSAPEACENVGWVSERVGRSGRPDDKLRGVTHHAERWVSLRSTHPTKRNDDKKKGSGTPTDVFSQPPHLAMRRASGGCARLSAFHHGSYRQGFRPLGAAPGQASWDVAGRSIRYARSNRGAKTSRSYAGDPRPPVPVQGTHLPDRSYAGQHDAQSRPAPGTKRRAV